MNDNLLKRYIEYASTEEALAVLFVKKHLARAKGHWVDIVECRRYETSADPLHFRFVVGGLYKRKVQPQYPPKSEYTVDGRFNERKYYLMTRAITWETAHKDIEQQESQRINPVQFKITGVRYPKNRREDNYFRDDAPPEIKALAKNLNDRTNPLWDEAMQYVVKQEYVYEIKRVAII